MVHRPLGQGLDSDDSAGSFAMASICSSTGASDHGHSTAGNGRWCPSRGRRGRGSTRRPPQDGRIGPVLARAGAGRVVWNDIVLGERAAVIGAKGPVAEVLAAGYLSDFRQAPGAEVSQCSLPPEKRLNAGARIETRKRKPGAAKKLPRCWRSITYSSSRKSSAN